MEVRHAQNLPFVDVFSMHLTSRNFYKTGATYIFIVSFLSNPCFRLLYLGLRIVLPIEWTSTMRPLQDQCEPSSHEALEDMFLSDTGQRISDVFEEFDPNPIGVASLAQVHVGTLKSDGRKVAVKVGFIFFSLGSRSVLSVRIKLQHPHLDEFCDIDMEMVEVTLGMIILFWRVRMH